MAIKKTRTLYVLLLLLEKTDKDRMLTMEELTSLLEERYQISADRKTIYSDMKLLAEFGGDFGYTLVQQRGSNPGYYITDRLFDLGELKLLVDVIQASNFITQKKSDELIRKLQRLAGESGGKKLNRQVFIDQRSKSDNETVFENVNTIYDAIACSRQIRFKYLEWDLRKKALVRKKGGKDYIVSPWALVWDDENYYLVAYDMLSGGERHYRVDKMERIRICEDLPREHTGEFNGDLAAFSKKTFGMFSGEDVGVTLRGKKHLAGVILDRFGRDIMIVPKGSDEFQVHLDISISTQFYGWLAGLGGDIWIVSPQEVREGYRRHLDRILEHYK